MRGSRKRIAASVAVPCAYSASISSSVAGCESRRAPDVAAGRGEPQLVRDDLHRRGEIERRVVGIGGNRRDDAASRELVVGQPRHLGAEHERDVAVRRVRDRLGAPPRARPARAPRTRAAAPTGRRRRRSRRAPRRASRRPRRASSTAVAPDASASASGSGKRRGRDEHEPGRAPSSASRARRAPMLPGWLGATSTMRIAREAIGRGVIGMRVARCVEAAAGSGYNDAPSRRLTAVIGGATTSRPTMHPMLTTAVKAARRAGNIINRGARDLDLLTVTAKGPKDFVSEVDRAAEAAIVETLLATLSRPRDSSRGRHGQRRQRRGRERLDHRPARRHDQLPARLSAVLRVDRARAPRPDRAGRDLRSRAQRPLHRLARTRRVPQRPPHPRLQAPAPARLPDRHRLSVPRRQLSRHLPRDDEGDDQADGRPAPARRRRARSRLCRRGFLRRVLGSRAQRLGRRGRQPARPGSGRPHRRPRRRRRIPARRPGDRRHARRSSRRW